MKFLIWFVVLGNLALVVTTLKLSKDLYDAKQRLNKNDIEFRQCIDLATTGLEAAERYRTAFDLLQDSCNELSRPH